MAKQMLTEVVLKSFRRAGLSEHGGIVAVIYERRDDKSCGLDSLLVEDDFDWKTAKDIKLIYELPFA